MASTSTATVAKLPLSSGAAVALGLALAAPLAGLALLLAAPSADVRWEHHPSHFWLVLGSALVAAVLGWSVGEAARSRRDARLFLVSLAFLAAAGFLALHALATPRVLLDGPNAGFVLATPVGLLLAAGFAAWSALPLDGARAAWVNRHAPLLRAGLLMTMLAWGGWSLASLTPLDDTSPPEARSAFLVALAVPAVVLLGFAAARYLLLTRARHSALLLAIAAAWVLLAEAMLAVAVARNWRASWWEWHVLLLVAFATIAWAARRAPDAERFGDLYLAETGAGTRDVSVLFADLAGFTAFSEVQAPAVVQEMLNSYFEAVVPAIVAEGGRVERVIGDAIMATFNVAAEQPDHAERAARAALALQAAAGAVAGAHAGWPRFRAGVNSGSAAVGVVGAGEGRAYTVLGDTVNVASRIEGLAPVGAVAIGAETLRRLDGATVARLGEMAVKGRRDTVEIWRLDALG